MKVSALLPRSTRLERRVRTNTTATPFATAMPRASHLLLLAAALLPRTHALSCFQRAMAFANPCQSVIATLQAALQASGGDAAAALDTLTSSNTDVTQCCGAMKGFSDAQCLCDASLLQLISSVAGVSSSTLTNTVLPAVADECAFQLLTVQANGECGVSPSPPPPPVPQPPPAVQTPPTAAPVMATVNAPPPAAGQATSAAPYVVTAQSGPPASTPPPPPPRNTDVLIALLDKLAPTLLMLAGVPPPPRAATLLQAPPPPAQQRSSAARHVTALAPMVAAALAAALLG